jgi:hypothetical protein
LFTHSRREAKLTLSHKAVNSIFLHSDQIFHIIAFQKCIQILTFISVNHLFIHSILSFFNVSCCLSADKHIWYELSEFEPKTHHSAIIESHSYLLINHFSSIIILDISVKNSLKNFTNSSGENFSEILVNHSISEKKIAISFFSQSKLIFHSHDNISRAISTETYSESALFNFVLCLFSIKYLTIFDNVRDRNIDIKNSKGKFINVFVNNGKNKTHKIKIETKAILLKTRT